MNHSYLLSLVFIFGLVAESFVLTDIKKYKQILIALLTSLGLAVCIVIRVLIDSSENPYDENSFPFFVLIFAATYSIVFGYTLKREILKSITETTLIVWNMFFLYIYFNTYTNLNIFSYIVILFSFATIISGYVGKRASSFFKILFYSWFLFMIVFVSIKNFSFYNLKNIFVINPIGLNYFTALITGMSFLYIIVNFWFLFRLIPIPSKHQKFKDRMREWREDTELMANKFSDKQVKSFVTTLIIVIFCGLFFVSKKMSIANEWMLANFAITLMSLSEIKHFNK